VCEKRRSSRADPRRRSAAGSGQEGFRLESAAIATASTSPSSKGSPWSMLPNPPFPAPGRADSRSGSIALISGRAAGQELLSQPQQI